MKKSIENGKVVFTFDAVGGVAVESVTFDPAKCSDAVKKYALPFAFMHRLGDAAALSRTDKDGKVRNITDVMRREAIMELIAHYESGSSEWNVKVRAAGKGEDSAIVVRAIMEATGKDAATVNQWIEKRIAGTEGLTKAKLYASFRAAGTKTAAIIERLEKERDANIKPAFNADELLGEI